MKHRNSIVLTALILAVAACAGTDANKTGSDVTDLTAATYTVAPSAAVGVTPGASSIGVSQALKLTTKFVDEKGHKIVGNSSAPIQWTSSDSTIAFVSNNGLVKGVRDGVVNITARYGNETAVSVVTVGTGHDTTTVPPAPGAPAQTTPAVPVPAAATPPPATLPPLTAPAATAPSAPVPPPATEPPPATQPPATQPVTTQPATTQPPISSSEPLPRSGDRILVDGRVSMQQATSMANIWPGAPRGTVPDNQLTYELNPGLKFAADIDGKGTHALRVDWTSFNGHCGDQQHQTITYLPEPFAKHIIVSFKQLMGRTATGGGIGALNSFEITNSGNGCDFNAGRKILLVCRVNADGGCYDRMDYDHPGPAPVRPRVDNNNQNLNFEVLPGVTFNPQEHVGQVLTQTLELQAESQPGASDGIVRLWINGQKVIENVHARIGAEAFNRFQLTPTFNSPAQDQTEYIWDVVSWVPQG